MINYSVIIPHFTMGGTELLERAVRSIPEREDVEIIIVDNSLIPIDENKFDKRLNTYILFSDNCRGAGGARNVGIEHAKGQWLLFVDADDFFCCEAFISFDKYLNSDNDIIYFKPTSFYSDTGFLADRHIVYCKMIDEYLLSQKEDLLRISHCVPWCKMISKKFIDENQIYFEEVPASNDVIFSLKIGLNAKKIAADNSVVYCVSVVKGSITNTESIRNIKSVFEVRIRSNYLLKQYGYKPSYSVLYQIYRASKFGIRPCCKLFFRACLTGNLFVGWRNWYKTFRNGVKRCHKYIVKQ